MDPRSLFGALPFSDASCRRPPIIVLAAGVESRTAWPYLEHRLVRLHGFLVLEEDCRSKQIYSTVAGDCRTSENIADTQGIRHSRLIQGFFRI